MKSQQSLVTIPVIMLHQSAGRGIKTMPNIQLSQTSHTKPGTRAATPINRYGLNCIFRLINPISHVQTIAERVLCVERPTQRCMTPSSFNKWYQSLAHDCIPHGIRVICRSPPSTRVHSSAQSSASRHRQPSAQRLSLLALRQVGCSRDASSRLQCSAEADSTVQALAETADTMLRCNESGNTRRMGVSAGVESKYMTEIQ